MYLLIFGSCTKLQWSAFQPSMTKRSDSYKIVERFEIKCSMYSFDFSVLRIDQSHLQPWSKHLGTVMKIKSENALLNFETLNPPLKKGWQCCFSKPFLFSPLPPSNVESTENDLNA